jgi:hypothetical protein
MQIDKLEELRSKYKIEEIYSISHYLSHCSFDYIKEEITLDEKQEFTKTCESIFETRNNIWQIFSEVMPKDVTIYVTPTIVRPLTSRVQIKTAKSSHKLDWNVEFNFPNYARVFGTFIKDVEKHLGKTSPASYNISRKKEKVIKSNYENVSVTFKKNMLESDDWVSVVFYGNDTINLKKQLLKQCSTLEESVFSSLIPVFYKVVFSKTKSNI